MRPLPDLVVDSSTVESRPAVLSDWGGGPAEPAAIIRLTGSRRREDQDMSTIVTCHFRSAVNDLPSFFLIKSVLPSPDIVMVSTKPLSHVAVAIPAEHVHTAFGPVLFRPAPPSESTVSLSRM
jgi:hypothetical protein